MMYDWVNPTRDFMFGSMFGIITAGALLVALLVVAAVYVYHAIAWSDIGKKQKYPHYWLAWVPFANISMILEMGGFNWAWIFLILVPIAGWLALFVLFIISAWRIFEKQKYPGWFSLSVVLPQVGWILYMIVIGFAAWGKGMNNDYTTSVRDSSRKNSRKK